jgi:precorrin-2 dehydrogenase/sirohydrochlorin ferrochelatase
VLPIIVNVSRVKIAVAGTGAGLQRRLKLLANAGVRSPTVLDSIASGGSLAGCALLFVAGVDEAQSQQWAQIARSEGVLVNVEDMPALCDFHVPAQVRRGDLLLTVSTAGRSPALTRILRERLEELFGPQWAGILERLSAARAEWRAQSLPPDEVASRTRAMLQQLE